MHRARVTRLAEQGHSVLLASHLLHEVEQVSDHVIIIQRGKKLTEGSVDDLLRQIVGMSRGTRYYVPRG